MGFYQARDEDEEGTGHDRTVFLRHRFTHITGGVLSEPSFILRTFTAQPIQLTTQTHNTWRLPGWLRASCGRHMRALRLCHTTSALFASADVIQGPFDGECRLQSGGRSTTPACNMSGQVGDDIGRDPTTPSGRVWRDGWEAGSIYGFTG